MSYHGAWVKASSRLQWPHEIRMCARFIADATAISDDGRSEPCKPSQSYLIAADAPVGSDRSIGGLQLCRGWNSGGRQHRRERPGRRSRSGASAQRQPDQPRCLRGNRPGDPLRITRMNLDLDAGLDSGFEDPEFQRIAHSGGTRALEANGARLERKMEIGQIVPGETESLA